jgi:hypothetical protein
MTKGENVFKAFEILFVDDWYMHPLKILEFTPEHAICPPAN